MTLHARDAASWKVAAPYARDAGAWKLATSVSAYDAGSWKTVAEILSLVVVTNGGNKANGETLTLGSTITGGYGALTYSWARSDVVGPAGNITGSSTNATVDLTGGTNGEATFTLTVTDSLTGTIVAGDTLVTWGVP